MYVEFRSFTNFMILWSGVVTFRKRKRRRKGQVGLKKKCEHVPKQFCSLYTMEEAAGVGRTWLSVKGCALVM